MSTRNKQPVFATAELTPRHVSAGEAVEFAIRLEAGPGYTQNCSRIIFDLPTTLGASRPSLFHHEDDGYITVCVSNPDVTYETYIWDVERGDFVDRTCRSWRAMAERLIVLDLSAGVKAGDLIELHWGDLGGGYGVGTQVTRIVPTPNYAARIDVRYFDSLDKGLPDRGRSFKGYDRPTPDGELSLTFEIEPRALHHLRLIRQVDRAALIPYDLFSNVSAVPRMEDLVSVDRPARRNEMGVFEFADAQLPVQSKGTPLTESPAMHDVVDGLNLYWGDMHTHSAFSRDCIERERMPLLPGDLMRYARDSARLDFYAVTDHQRPGNSERHKIGAENWKRTLDSIRAFDEAGRFLVFPGFEFKCRRGDTVILCNGFPEYEEIDRPEWSDLRGLWAAWSGRDYISIPHFHNAGELPIGEWWEQLDPNIEPVLEIFSCAGSYERADVLENRPALEKQTRADRNGAYLLRAGFRYGFVCNSDGHKGHVGLNGLTAVFARSLGKADILDAYRRRRVYGTTNARIRLVFKGNGQLMGAILPNTANKQFSIDVRGENGLKRIDLFRNSELYRRLYPDGIEFHEELCVVDNEPSYWYVRVTQLDNQQAFSSPVWFEDK